MFSGFSVFWKVYSRYAIRCSAIVVLPLPAAPCTSRWAFSGWRITMFCSAWIVVTISRSRSVETLPSTPCRYASWETIPLSNRLISSRCRTVSIRFRVSSPSTRPSGAS